MIVLAAFVMGIASPDNRASTSHVAKTGAADRPPALIHYDRVLILNTTAERSANVSVGDLDGDGHLDILLINLKLMGARPSILQ